MNYQIYIVVIMLAFLSGFTTLIGVCLALFFRNKKNLIAAGLGFAAGIMLFISLFELIPESFKNIDLKVCLAVVTSGILVFYLLNYLLPHTHFFKEKGRLKCRLMQVACLVAIGLIIHDLPEGFAMANSYLLAPQLGILVAISIALHNIPEEFAIAVPLLLTRKKKFLFQIAVLSGLAEPVGAILGLVAGSFAPNLVPYFLAFAAGAMIFISFHELIPMARIYNKPQFLVLGVF